MKKALLLAAAALSLSSCHFYWNTGECLKESTVTYTGAHTTAPVGNTIYKAPDGTFYLQAPEVEYKLRHHVAGITPNGLGPGTDPDGVWISASRPTGRLLWVQVDAKQDKDGIHMDAKNGTNPRLVDAQPAGCKALRYQGTAPHIYTTERDLGSFSTKRSGWYWPACIAAVPLKYVVDPSLTVVTTVLGYTGITCGYIIATPFWAPDKYLASKQRDKSVFVEVIDD